MSRQHNHDINGKLHDECPACDLIRQVSPRVEKQRRDAVAVAQTRAKGDDV